MDCDAMGDRQIALCSSVSGMHCTCASPCDPDSSSCQRLSLSPAPGLAKLEENNVRIVPSSLAALPAAMLEAKAAPGCRVLALSMTLWRPLMPRWLSVPSRSLIAVKWKRRCGVCLLSCRPLASSSSRQGDSGTLKPLGGPKEGPHDSHSTLAPGGSCAPQGVSGSASLYSCCCCRLAMKDSGPHCVGTGWTPWCKSSLAESLLNIS